MSSSQYYSITSFNWWTTVPSKLSWTCPWTGNHQRRFLVHCQNESYFSVWRAAKCSLFIEGTTSINSQQGRSINPSCSPMLARTLLTHYHSCSYGHHIPGHQIITCRITTELIVMCERNPEKFQRNSNFLNESNMFPDELCLIAIK